MTERGQRSVWAWFFWGAAAAMLLNLPATVSLTLQLRAERTLRMAVELREAALRMAVELREAALRMAVELREAALQREVEGCIETGGRR